MLSRVLEKKNEPSTLGKYEKFNSVGLQKFGRKDSEAVNIHPSPKATLNMTQLA
jgi:hypothetical protein